MALRTVLKSNEPVLHEKAREVTVFDDRLAQALDDMRDTMLFEDGVGLAAPQIGILKRMCVISRDGEELIELINPVITHSDGNQICNEGCLSVPGVSGKVLRPLSITVKAQDRTGKHLVYKAEGKLANIFCHEIDHLNGILFTDRMEK